MKELIRKRRAKVLEIDTKPDHVLLTSNVDNTAMPECNFPLHVSIYIVRSTRVTDLRVLAPFHVYVLNNIGTKVSKPRMFYRELPFAVQTAKVFPLECFVVYGITHPVFYFKEM